MELKNTIVCKGKAYSEDEFVKLCIELGTRALVSEKLGCSPKTLTACLKKYYPDLTANKPLKAAFLELEGLAECSCCGEHLPLSDFYSRKSAQKGITSTCKECTKGKMRDWRKDNPDKVLEINRKYKKANPEKIKAWRRKYDAKRRATQLNCQPPWVDELEILEIYERCPDGYEVDHIVPLINSRVCGLHVPNNLQYLTSEENRKKSNKFKVE